MKFFYGVENNYTDVTSVIIDKMMCGNQILILPNDTYRANIFPDPKFGTIKHILVMDDYNNSKIYYSDDEIYLKLYLGKLNLNMQLDLKKQKKSIIITNARDEDNIEEWVIYHQKIGFDHVHIYDHNSIIPISKRVSKFDNCTVTRIEGEINTLPDFKINLYCKYSVLFAKNNGYEWMLYIDADEFLFLGENKVNNFIENNENYDLIKINWVLFTSNNYISQPSGLIIKNFTECYDKFNYHVKSFLKLKNYVINVVNVGIHSYNAKSYVCVNENKTSCSTDPFNKINKQIEIPYIAHYYCQSDEKLKERKIDRKRDDGGTCVNFIPILKEQPADINKIQNMDISNMYGNIVEEELLKYM